VSNGQLIQLRPLTRVEDFSDEALAAACATGDRAAQGLLFERHVDAVYRFIARMRGADAAAVDDLVQATFIAGFQSAAKFRGPKLRSWLFGIATNVLRRHIRKELSQRRIVASFGELPTRGDVPPVDADVLKLRTAIHALSTKLREVLVLVDLEGERGTDVAVALGIPEGTVWRRLSTARAQLRDLLEAGV
jgi:RNA polymerase sigma-70 factor (ECF subfamily)